MTERYLAAGSLAIGEDAAMNSLQRGRDNGLSKRFK